ncbi:MAG: phosphoglycerate mutase [Rhodovulum sulfidophilum]|uniref:Phosphoglycerate mutase n=1 Tax=Rhodovulum sulfidophilum TaxID=35806 RepID=A0A2W5N9E2_RHOSU|nr:MAG: phosphoglycerate mutase [Rhodovulum sulfidophilum]
MTRLILVRHAKSDWDDPRLGDAQRPLNKRGRADAPALGAWLRGRGYAADAALVSSAVRTTQTYARLHHEATPPPARFLDALYHAGPEVMLASLREAGPEVVMMVGHNPGIAGFAARLLAEPPRDADFDRYPTCAAAVIDFPVASWREIAWRTGTLVDFMIPKRLG